VLPAQTPTSDVAQKTRRSAVQSEIRQSRPFRSLAQEATVTLLRTASVVSRAIARVLEPSGLSLAQYNALRIIRGAGSGGIPTLLIRERMIEEGTTITRLLDKLEAAALIRRERSLPDRRQVICYPTARGKRLLDRLDPLVDAMDEEVVAALDPSRLEELVAMLDTIRSANAERGAPRTAAIRGAERATAPEDWQRRRSRPEPAASQSRNTTRLLHAQPKSDPV
jgi:MarR family transcriptional regulator, organic hydroperoxide resistance regulator